MTQPTPIYDSPENQPVSPLFEANEGYPLPPGVTPVQVFKNTPPGFPNVREVKRVDRIHYYDGGEIASFEVVEGGRNNDTTRMTYRQYQRFMRFLFLHIGIVDWEASPTFAADYDVDGFPTALLGKAWEFDAENVAGGGNEKKVLITWTDADAGTPSINNARALARESDGKPLSSIQVGDMVVDVREGTWGQAQILNIEYHAPSGDDHTATLTLNKQINAAREDKVWTARSNLPYFMPPISLQFETPVCKNAIRRADTTLSSYKTAYPSAYVSDGISGEWHCARMTNPAALIGTFEPFHVNTDCPLYEAHTPYLPLARHISAWWTERGWYLKMVSLLGGSSDANFRKGLENFPGIFQLCGVRNGFNSFSNSIRPKDTLFPGVLRFDTGGTTVNGFREFLNFFEIQAAHVSAAEDESDAGTFMEIMTGTPDKYDPAGGVSAASRLLIDDPDRTPGNTLAQNMAVRRIMSRALQQGEMDPGLSYGDIGSLSGQGTGQVQRVRPVRRASVAFTKGTPNTIRGTQTVLDVFATPQTLPASGETFDIQWVMPRFSDEALTPSERSGKGSFPNAANISFTGNLMTVEFGMQTYNLSRPAADPLPDIFNEAKIGGGAVASDIARVLLNPGDGDGVQFMGDPERRIFPGDSIAFDDDAVRDITLTCLSAKAFSGSVDPAAIPPHVGAPGIPQFVRDNGNKRDVAIFALSPENGEAIRQFVVGVGGSEQNIPVDYVAHAAVAPPIFDVDLNDTLYTPVLKKTLKSSGVTSVVPTNEYLWEPNGGGFYIDSSGWAAGDYVLFAEMWVFDARKVYPCEVSLAYESLIDGLCGLYYETTLSLEPAGFELLVDTAKPETLGPVYSIELDRDDSVPPFVPYELSTASFAVNQSDFPRAAITRTYVSPAAPASFAVGSSPSSFLDNPPDSRPHFGYENTMQAYSFSSLADIGRWRSEDIEEALIEISFEEGVITETWFDREFFAEDPDVEDSGSSTLSSTNLVVNLLTKTSGDDYDLQGTGISVPAPVTIIDIGGDDFLNGTVDITNLLKYVIDNAHVENIEFLLMVGAGIMPVGPLSVPDLAVGWMQYFFSTRTGDGDAPWEDGQRGIAIEYSEFTISNVYIRTKASALADGPELTRTNDDGGLNTDMPDLTFEPE